MDNYRKKTSVSHTDTTEHCERGNVQHYETVMSFGEWNGNKMMSYDDNNNNRDAWKQDIIIIIIRYVCLLSQAFLPDTSLEPAVIPTAQASSFTLQYFPY